MAAAQRIGLTIPRTLVTNEPKRALQFFEECRREMIYKPLTQGTPPPRVGEPWKGAIYTTKLTKTTLDLLAPSIAVTAHLFQAYSGVLKDWPN
ncbi:MAG: hypothetical protein J2P36_18650 [Ktedonobacteraceae bacterium]|nr:hypothetical protein [Ktedonobacteraceae bacterium]